MESGEVVTRTASWAGVEKLEWKKLEWKKLEWKNWKGERASGLTAAGTFVVMVMVCGSGEALIGTLSLNLLKLKNGLDNGVHFSRWVGTCYCSCNSGRKCQWGTPPAAYPCARCFR